MLNRLITAPLLAVAACAIVFAEQPRPTRGVEKDVTALGFKLHYIEAGSGAPVVLLHGLGGDGSRWAPNIAELAKDFHVFALDQIGFGQSDKPLANYHTGMLAEFLVDFMAAVNVPKASLVGNSMGASVALYTAVHYPAKVDRIVLADGGGFRRRRRDAADRVLGRSPTAPRAPEQHDARGDTRVLQDPLPRQEPRHRQDGRRAARDAAAVRVYHLEDSGGRRSRLRVGGGGA